MTTAEKDSKPTPLRLSTGHQDAYRLAMYLVTWLNKGALLEMSRFAAVGDRQRDENARCAAASGPIGTRSGNPFANLGKISPTFGLDR